MNRQDWYLPFGILCIAIGILIGCKNSQTAVNTVFTAEQAVCMTAGVLAEDLTKEPQTVASNLSAACGILPGLTQDVINFVQSFTKTPAGQSLKMKALKSKAPIVP